MHTFGEVLLDLGVQRRPPARQELLSVIADDVGDQPARVLLLVGAAQLALAAVKPTLLFAVQPVPDLAVNGA